MQLTSRDAELYREAVATGHLMKIRAAACTAGTSAKMQRIRGIVEEAAANGWKVVVFSFFRAVLDAVRVELGPRVVGVLNGSRTPTTRQKLIDDFDAVDGHAVLVSQIESGGLGLFSQVGAHVVAEVAGFSLPQAGEPAPLRRTDRPIRRRVVPGPGIPQHPAGRRRGRRRITADALYRGSAARTNCSCTPSSPADATDTMVRSSSDIDDLLQRQHGRPG